MTLNQSEGREEAANKCVLNGELSEKCFLKITAWSDELDTWSSDGTTRQRLEFETQNVSRVIQVTLTGSGGLLLKSSGGGVGDFSSRGVKTESLLLLTIRGVSTEKTTSVRGKLHLTTGAQTIEQ